jgi:nickel-dependent lactate racemase
MRSYTVPYGQGQQQIHLSGSEVVDVIDPVDLPSAGVGAQAVAQALDAPLGSERLDAYASAGSVAIAINDKTRPVPHHLLLPPLLERLEALGLGPKVRFYVATGTHLPMPPESFASILPPETLGRYPVVSHDCDDAENLVQVGNTSRGVPVWVNRAFYASDLKIVVGNVEPHHFAGFSGGYKTAAIGLAGRQTINANHAMLADPLSIMGEFERNPLRQDIEEIGRHMGVQFALNARLNAKKEILDVYFGDPAQVLAAAIPETRRVTQTAVEHAYDIVISSPGGHPKDINFYQAQKAITPAAMMTRDGGTVILVAACPEGSGSMAYEEFMQGVTSFDQVFQKFHDQGFRVGPHKALQVALVGRRVRLVVVSELLEGQVRNFLLTPAQDLQSAYVLAASTLPESPRVAILPHATNVIPRLGV